MGKNDLGNMSPEEIEKKAQEVLKKMKNENISAAQAMGMNEEFLEEMYSLAHAHYERGNYTESIALFQFLAGVSPGTHKYMMGLAANYHQIGQYEDAINGFHVALNSNPEDPVPIFYIGDCLMKLGMEGEAASFFQIVAEIGDEFPEYKEFREKSRLILSHLKEKGVSPKPLHDDA
ncbi:MAG: SycD/LcrH family type III secretion system chaperone [Chlamydiales bacterium]|nr:SycD/LcrH family type III secretion system chaperone [Chlamydiales bacterium]